MQIRRVVSGGTLTGLALIALIGCQSDQNQEELSDVGAIASADMAAPDGASMGTVVLTQGPNGVLVSADLSGLSEGWHGFHVHSVGSCSPDFSAAGGHLAFGDKGHGYLHEAGFHAGDMPNIHAGADGAARADVFNVAISLASGADTSIFDEDGTAIIVHAEPDTYGESPGAGDRVSCGVISPGRG